VALWLIAGSSAAVEDTPHATVDVNAMGLRFNPPVVLLRPGETLRIYNVDKKGFGFKHSGIHTGQFSYLCAAEAEFVEFTFGKEEPLPVAAWLVPDGIEIAGHIVIRNTTSVALSDKEGMVRLAN